MSSIFNPANWFKAPPPPETGKKPTNAQLFSDTAIEDLVEALMAVPDPDMVLEQAGLTRADLRRMEYDDEITTALETRLAAVQAAPMRIEPGEGEQIEWLWGEIEPHLDALVAGAWSALPYGYSVMEVIYRRTPEGRIGIDRVEERPFEWFRPHPDGTLRYFPENGAQMIEVDTQFKFLLTRNRATYRNPYGRAILSRLFGAFFLRQAGWKFWPQFLERFGAPLLVGKTRGDTAEMAKALATALQAAVVAIHEDDDVTAVTATGDGQAFERFELHVTKRIQKVILGQTLTTDVGDRGSYAAARVHNEVRDDRRDADIAMITPTLQRVIDALWTLNGWGDDYPQIMLDAGAGLQLDRAERDAKLAQAGIVRFTEEYLLRAYDFEVGDFEIAAPQAAQPAPAAAQASALPPGPLRLAAPQGERFTPAQQAIEALADDALRQATAPISAEALARALKAATSPEDLTTRLAALYQGTDPAEYRDLLERALFAADLMGYVHDDEQSDIDDA